MTDKINPSDEREEKGSAPAAHCEDGCCSWHDNTPAQSEGKVKTGEKKPRPI